MPQELQQPETSNAQTTPENKRKISRIDLFLDIIFMLLLIAIVVTSFLTSIEMGVIALFMEVPIFLATLVMIHYPKTFFDEDLLKEKIPIEKHERFLQGMARIYRLVFIYCELVLLLIAVLGLMRIDIGYYYLFLAMSVSIIPTTVGIIYNKKFQ